MTVIPLPRRARPSPRHRPSNVVLYGATGYTGRLLLEEARRARLPITVAGRDAARVSALARAASVPFASASVSDASALDAMLRGATVLLNAAGPFSRTAAPLMAAALRAGVHYLDVTGELDVFLRAVELDAAARRARVMLMPGAGFDVVPSDCLALTVARQLPGATALHLGIAGLRQLSRGSARTLVQHVARPIRARRDRRVVPLAPAPAGRDFDLDGERRRFLAIDWGDVVTAYYTTGIPNVTTYFEATPALRAALLSRSPSAALLGLAPARACLEAMTRFLPAGPSAEQRAAARVVLVAEAEAPSGARASAQLVTGDVYEFTARAAVSIAAKVSRGDWEPGFQTPARVFGSELAASLPGVVSQAPELGGPELGG